MTPAEADAEARYWWGYALALGRRFPVPPLYTREDWEAEALLGLAKALRHMDPARSAPERQRFIETVVTNHMRRALRYVLSAPPGGRDLDPPRATYGRAASLDAPNPQVEGEGTLARHDTVPGRSPDPVRALDEAVLLDALQTLKESLSPAYRQALGFLLRGTPPAEVAALTGETESAVSNRRTRVRRKVADALEPLGYSC